MLSLESDGVAISQNEIVKAIVVAIVGDNLGAHNIGGFSENFSTGEYFCRFCTVGRSDFSSNALAVGALRTPTTYDIHASMAADTSCSLEQSSGVKCKSVFNKLGYFHVAKPGLPPCIGHEGI